MGSTSRLAVQQARPTRKRSTESTKRKDSDELYVIDLCDQVLNLKAIRQHRFDFLLGDPGKTGRCTPLPVDAWYPELKLVMEYREKQHTESVKIMDQRMTVSGVKRGEQRRIYDERRREILPKHGITLIELDFSEFSHSTSKRLLGDPQSDLSIIRSKLKR